jgi:hypothetical protein
VGRGPGWFRIFLIIFFSFFGSDRQRPAIAASCSRQLQAASPGYEARGWLQASRSFFKIFFRKKNFFFFFPEGEKGGPAGIQLVLCEGFSFFVLNLFIYLF